MLAAMTWKRWWILCLGVTFGALAQNESPQEAVSLLNEPLLRPELPAEVKADFEKKLAIAKADWEKAPDTAESWIWYGRRTAYLGRYNEAINIYSSAIARFPEDARLFRHRGHRYLSTRQLDKAIADFEKAAALVEGKPDQVEPDGLPNAKNIPTSTLQTNIWYHLGLAYYLSGDFEKAAKAYEKCLLLSKNDDMWCATAHWLYMSLQRLGNKDAAKKVLDPVHNEMNIIENEGYYQLLQAYKDPSKMLALRDEKHSDGVQSATIAYGLANWLYYQGAQKTAASALNQILIGDAWAAFGYLAAEADVARLKANPSKSP